MTIALLSILIDGSNARIEGVPGNLSFLRITSNAMNFKIAMQERASRRFHLFIWLRGREIPSA
ncbi:hypothetical protein [Sphingobium sp.]|uniref:hypothetical protein n=1 Tax=Sphingobium sp. TaxID=1912891 RepID=UPI002D18BAB7|nr:hypothetical protein [Sphingobium sp.]HUD94837.1 hypothetical protein [Sphingobium sp.]